MKRAIILMGVQSHIEQDITDAMNDGYEIASPMVCAQDNGYYWYHLLMVKDEGESEAK